MSAATTTAATAISSGLRLRLVSRRDGLRDRGRRSLLGRLLVGLPGGNLRAVDLLGLGVGLSSRPLLLVGLRVGVLALSALASSASPSAVSSSDLSASSFRCRDLGAVSFVVAASACALGLILSVLASDFSSASCDLCVSLCLGLRYLVVGASALAPSASATSLVGFRFRLVDLRLIGFCLGARLVGVSHIALVSLVRRLFLGVVGLVLQLDDLGPALHGRLLLVVGILVDVLAHGGALVLGGLRLVRCSLVRFNFVRLSSSDFCSAEELGGDRAGGCGSGTQADSGLGGDGRIRLDGLGVGGVRGDLLQVGGVLRLSGGLPRRRAARPRPRLRHPRQPSPRRPRQRPRHRFRRRSRRR